MSISFLVSSSLVVFIFSGLLAMAGLGAAFLFVPFFYIHESAAGRSCPHSFIAQRSQLVIGRHQLLAREAHQLACWWSRARKPFRRIKNQSF